MTVIHMPNYGEIAIPIGSMVVHVGGEVRAFDPLTDYDSKTETFLTEVIGVSYPPTYNNGRGYTVIDGPEFYFNDVYQWKEDFTVELDENQQPVSNPAYEGWNPTEPSKFSYVMISGFGPFLNSQEAYKPARWSTTNIGDTISMAIIR